MVAIGSLKEDVLQSSNHTKEPTVRIAEDGGGGGGGGAAAAGCIQSSLAPLLDYISPVLEVIHELGPRDEVDLGGESDRRVGKLSHTERGHQPALVVHQDAVVAREPQGRNATHVLQATG